MGWVPDHVIEEMRGSHLLGIFLHVATDPALHMWFGVHDIPAKIDSVDADGTVYLGGGRLNGLPTLEVLVNGTADNVEMTMSGIDPAAAARMLESIPAVRGRDVFVGLTTLDQYYQPMSNIIPVWHGTASHVAESSAPVAGNQNRSISLSLLVTSGEGTRSRPSRALWSSAHQKAQYPTDKFCDQTPRMARGVAPDWPKYT